MKFYENSGLRHHTVKSMSNGTEGRPGEKDSDLASFLARPVRIWSSVWTPGTSFEGTVDIWKEFLNETSVAAKIEHFSRIRGKLVVKLLVNGNAMYFGKLVMYYLPYMYSDEFSSYTAVPQTGEWVQIMQRPHVSLDATTTTGAVMELPMLLPGDWFDLISPATGDSKARIGTLAVQDLNALAHANGGTEPLTVTLVAWMEDAELYLPTSTSEVVVEKKKKGKPKDEYAQAQDQPLSISGTLTTVSNMAQIASALPVIGPFAKATEIIGRAGASVAKIFGYSRPPLLEPAAPFVPRYLGSLANCDSPETVQKLTLNGRQEVCVDSSPIGVDTGQDEMALSNLVTKEGYFTTFLWTPANTADARLLGMAVNPMYFGRVEPAEGGTNYAYYLTPLAYFSQPFNYWRGSLRFRFEVVASAYHRGRLRVVWDPSVFSLSAPYNQNFSVVLDIAEQRDFTVVVPYGATAPYLQNSRQPEDGLIYGAAYTDVNPYTDNGTLTVCVLNELSSMNDAGDNAIYVNVYVSAGDDFRVAMPCAEKLAQNRFVSTSEIVTESAVDTTLQNSSAPITSGSSDCRVDDVVFGETVVSFRSLLKRYNFATVFVPTIGASKTRFHIWRISSFPVYRGSMNSARDSYNYCFHSLLNHLTPCFLGYRGSIRHKFMLTSRALGTSLAASLAPAGTDGRYYSYNYYILDNGAASDAYQLLSADGNPWFGLTGSAVTPSDEQPVLEVEVPYYMNKKYISARILNLESPAGNDAYAYTATKPPGLNLSCISPHNVTPYVADFVSVGEDFSLHYFISVPRMYRGYDAAPA